MQRFDIMAPIPNGYISWSRRNFGFNLLLKSVVVLSPRKMRRQKWLPPHYDPSCTLQSLPLLLLKQIIGRSKQV